MSKRNIVIVPLTVMTVFFLNCLRLIVYYGLKLNMCTTFVHFSYLQFELQTDHDANNLRTIYQIEKNKTHSFRFKKQKRMLHLRHENA